jgi:glycosyltransferase involved in cell wall biosynthesis
MQEFPDWHAVVAGNGDDFNKLETFAKAVNKEKKARCIHLLGEQKDMDELYAAADCVVGTGRVALEAMSFGKPVIAAGSSGMIGVVTPFVHNLAVETHFSEHENGGFRVQRQVLGASLRQVMQDERSAAAWGKEGLQLIRKVYDNQRLTERWIQLYLKTIKLYREDK